MGKTPKVPPPPPPSPQELELMTKQGQLLDQYMKSIEDTKAQNKQLGIITAVSSGLYDPVYENGTLVDAKLNPEKLANLQEDFSRGEEVNRLLLDRYERALKGELPVSEALLQRKTQDFQLLKEGAARRGVSITGGTLEEAARTPQNSTSGNELVGRLSSTYRLAEDAERRGELSAGAPLIGANTLNLATSGQATFGPSSVLNAEATGVQLFPGVLAPYQGQRNLQYNASVNNAALRSQRQAAIYNGIGQLTGQAIGAYAAMA